MEVERLPRASETNPEVPRRPPPGTGPVARVNGEEISRAEYDLRVQRTLDAFFGLARSMPRSVWKQVVGGTLNQLVQRSIDRQKARELEVSVLPEELDREFRVYVDARGGAANLPRLLLHTGVSEEEIREDIHAKLLHDKVLARRLGEIRISDAQVEEHYSKQRYDFFVQTRRQLRQIFLRTHEGYDSKLKLTVLGQAEEAVRMLREEGRGFEEVARLRSEGGTRGKGGDLGWLHKGQMPAQFDRIAFSMKVGSISGIISTEMGFHIIQCLAEEPGYQRRLDEKLRAEIRGRLASRTRQKLLGELHRRWYGEARVEYLDPLIEAEAREMERRSARYRSY